MLQHPGVLLAEYIKENGYTQKDFSKKIGKKTSEINELIRGKRNITVARDVILSKYLSTPPKFRILKQVDYDYEQLLTKQLMEDKGMLSKDVEIIQENAKYIENNGYLTNIDNSFFETTLQNIIDEENRQSRYLRENVFQEDPIQEEKIKNDEILEINQNKNQEKKELSIKELLKEDPVNEITPLAQVFDSF